ncbi:MAG: group II intron reverse transcriptase/maturase [Fibrobacterota bacterium]|nr:group II intron reverse transcriptase/maturase [Fibrobacterota bacterium]
MSAMQELMERVVERENLKRAYARVVSNGGSPGVDAMPVEALKEFLGKEWPRLKKELLEDRYEPQPVRGVEIPKPGGKGMRQLGIPTVLDRFIQQALHQVLSPLWEPDFSEHSYGFREGRSAHQAVLAAQKYIQEGRTFVVDLDLEKFFDRVQHDVLMAKVARKVGDKRVLRLIRRYLQAGLMKDGGPPYGGLVEARREGTPQGGPISPLLSNILLDEFDRELEKRGHAFCRYADDSNIYVRSKAAGERVMASVTRFLEERLKLRVNREKSAVDRPWKRKFLGYSFAPGKEARLKAAPESVARLKEKIRERMRRGRGQNVARVIEESLTPLLRGWVNYFRLAEVKNTFEELDGWIRRKLRAILWRQWKRVFTRVKNLMRLGLEKVRALKSAMNGRGPWWNAGASHMNTALPKKYFDKLGLLSLVDQRLKYG